MTEAVTGTLRMAWVQIHPRFWLNLAECLSVERISDQVWIRCAGSDEPYRVHRDYQESVLKAVARLAEGANGG